MIDPFEQLPVRVVAFVEAHQPVPLDDLASMLDLTASDLRKATAKANALLDGCAQVVGSARGQVLSVRDAHAFSLWREAHYPVASSVVPSSPQERTLALACDLLLRSNWITIDRLADLAFCSRRTVSSDLVRVEAELAPYGVALEKRPHYGIRVAGPEFARRLCLAGVMVRRLAADSGQESGCVPDLALITRCADEATGAAGYSIRQTSYLNLVVHIAVAVMRLRAHQSLPEGTVDVGRLEGTDAWPVACAIAREVGQTLGVELPQVEVAYIALHLAGKHVYVPGASSSPSRSPLEPSSVADAESWALARDMVFAVRDAYRIDLIGDIELRQSLARHIGPLGVRLMYGIRLTNPLGVAVRERYRLAYSLAEEASGVLAARYGTAVAPDEVAYLTLPFSLALQMQGARKRRPKNVLVVCASGLGSARLLEMRCREEFGDSLGAIATCDISLLDQADLSGIDYVLTTVPIEASLPVPVLEVSYFLDGADVVQVRRLLDMRDVGPGAWEPYFDPHLFVAHAPWRTREEVLDGLCSLAAGTGELDEGFGELVERRERVSPTAFGNRVAIPHPIVAASARTTVACCVLDEDVDWGGSPVRVVFLVAVSKVPTEDLRDFYDMLLGLTSSEDAIGRLCDEPAFETLASLLDQAGTHERRG